MNKKGFTLIELIISITIMSFMVLMLTRSLKATLSIKTKIQNEIDRNSAVATL